MISAVAGRAWTACMMESGMMMNKRVVASLAAGASALVLCAGTAIGQGETRTETRRGVLSGSHPIAVVESPLRIDSREHASPFSTPLTVSRGTLDELRGARQVTMVGFPLSAGELVDLDLRPISVFDRRAEFVSGAAEADSLDDLGRAGRSMLFSGEVAGAPGSSVFLAFTPTGTNGFVSLDGETHLISSGAHAADAQPRIFNLTTLPEGVINWKEFQCSAIDPRTLLELNDAELTPERAEQVLAQLPIRPVTDPGSGSGSARGDEPGDDCRIVNVAIETDVELGQEFGSSDNSREALLDYVETLVGAINVIYTRNINLQFNVIFVRDWIDQPTDADPWEGLSTADVLFELRAEWTPTSAPTGLNWQGVHLLSSRNLGGGVAFLSGICNLDIAHAVSADLNAGFPLDGNGQPVSNLATNWDIVVVAHEWGHNLGAPHTHGLQPPVDACAFGDCSTATTGTIMSYCHLCPGGLQNIDLNFNDRIIREHMRPFLVGEVQCDLVRGGETCDLPVDVECIADVNGDMVLNGADFSAWIIAYNLGDLAADSNRDGRISPADFNAWLASFNAGCDFGGS